MLERKVAANISSWLGDGRKALLVEGARQVGKTYIIREVLEREKCDWREFNLIDNPDVADILRTSRTVEEMVAGLSFFSRRPFEKGRTVFFFDEVQVVPDVITKIKFWVDEGSFRYILSGSLLGVETGRLRSAPVGYMTILKVYPLDFQEFLQIYGFSEDAVATLYRSFCEKTPVNEAVHRRMMKCFSEYLAVGGMPEAVETYRKTRDMKGVMAVHNDIANLHMGDFIRYAAETRKPYIARIYEMIPSELYDSCKRFNFTDLKKGLTYERIEDSFL